MDARHKILYVEDNDLFSRMLVARLSPDFEIVCVESFEDAETELKRGSFAGCLLDLNLPDTTGIATLKAFRKLSTIPVIVVSGIDDDQLYVKALLTGAKEFFGKEQLINNGDVGRLGRAINRYFVSADEPTPFTEILTLCASINQRVMAAAILQ